MSLSGGVSVRSSLGDGAERCLQGRPDADSRYTVNRDRGKLLMEEAIRSCSLVDDLLNSREFEN